MGRNGPTLDQFLSLSNKNKSLSLSHDFRNNTDSLEKKPKRLTEKAQQIFIKTNEELKQDGAVKTTEMPKSSMALTLRPDLSTDQTLRLYSHLIDKQFVQFLMHYMTSVVFFYKV
jgi:lipopolysaccharide export system protein LptC